MQIWKIIFLFLINFSIAKCQSCSNFANFYSDHYGGIFGQVEIPRVPFQSYSFFEVELSVAARLPSNNDWKIVILNTNVYDDLMNGRNIILKFVPLITNPLPIVTGVFLNGNRLCSSSPARGSYVSTIKMSHTYTISNIPQNAQTNSRPVPNQSYYHQNQETTRRIIYTQPTTRATQPPIPAKPRQTTQVYIDNKLGTISSAQTFVCGVRRNQLGAVSFVVGGQKGKYFTRAVNRIMPRV
ncbi:hypothetical protein ACKWTF_010355 [Chironomus riparius]